MGTESLNQQTSRRWKDGEKWKIYVPPAATNMRPGRDDRQESTTSCDDVAQVRRWSPSCVLRRPWRTKQVHEVDQTSHPTPRHSFIALSLPRSAQCSCNRKGGEEEKRRSLTSLQTCHTHTPPGGVQRQSQTVHRIQFHIT